MSKHKERGPGKVVGHQDRQLLGDVATRAYVDHHVQVLQAGVLKHAVLDIVTSPPASPVAGMYIVGKNPTGAFAGWAGKIVLHVPGFGGSGATWADIDPADKEQRLVESKGKIYQYQSTTSDWVEIAVASVTPSSFPKVKFHSLLNGDASGTLFAESLTLETNHLYRFFVGIGANYNNESDRYAVEFKRNNVMLLHVNSAVMHNEYFAYINMEWWEKHTAATALVDWAVVLKRYDAGTFLQHRQFVVTDYGPQA